VDDVGSVELPDDVQKYGERIAAINSEIRKFQYLIEEEIGKYKRYQVNKYFYFGINLKLKLDCYNFNY
jgi:hypothetical protein